MAETTKEYNKYFIKIIVHNNKKLKNLDVTKGFQPGLTGGGSHPPKKPKGTIWNMSSNSSSMTVKSKNYE